MIICGIAISRLNVGSTVDKVNDNGLNKSSYETNMKLSFKCNSSSFSVRYSTNRVCSLVNWCSTTEKSKTNLKIHYTYYVVMSYVIKLSLPYIQTLVHGFGWYLHLMMSLQLTELEIISVSTHEIRTNYGENIQRQIIIILIYNHFLWFVIVFETSKFVLTNEILFLSIGNPCFLFICSCSTSSQIIANAE